MKRISEARAIELINSGIHPKCKVSRDLYEVIRSLTELERFRQLGKSKLQLYELYTDDSLSIDLPDNAMELTLNDAFELVSSKSIIHAIRNGENIEISTINELREFISSCKIRGDKFVLYWVI